MPKTKIMPDMVYKFTRTGSPRLVNTMLSNPVLGDPRIAHATPATSGGTNSGNMPIAAINPFAGVSVRTTIQAKNKPITTAIAVPPAQAISELASATCTFGLASTAMKLSSDGRIPASPSTTGLASVSAPSSNIPVG